MLAQTDPLRPQPVPHEGPQVCGGEREPAGAARLHPPVPLYQVLGVRGADGSYHRNITGTVRRLCQTALLDAGRGVPGEADHGPVGGVEAGAGVALPTGARAVALSLGDAAAVVVVLPLPPLGERAPLAPPAGLGVVRVALAAAARQVLVLQPGLGRGPASDTRAGRDSVVLVSTAASLAGLLASRSQQQIHPGGSLSIKYY